MRLTNEEKETGINFNEASPEACVYTHSAALKRQLLGLCRSHPGQVRLTASNDWGGLTFELPKKWLKISPPRVLTPAQRAVLDKMNENRRNSRES